MQPTIEKTKDPKKKVKNFEFFSNSNILGYGANSKILKGKTISNSKKNPQVGKKCQEPNTSSEWDTAVKMVSLDLLKNDLTLLKRVKNRIAASDMIAKYDNPYLMKIKDYGETCNNLYIFTELFEDGNLLTKLQRQPASFTLNQVLEITYQLILGIYSLHFHSIAHRDINLKNIYIKDSSEGIYTLGGFGCFRMLGEENNKHKSFKSNVGCDKNKCPEFYIEDASKTLKVDIWSVGCILYELLFGRHFLDEVSEIDYGMFIKNTPIQIPEITAQGENVSNVVKKLLAGT